MNDIRLTTMLTPALEKPRPVRNAWIDDLLAMRSKADLRSYMLERLPELQPEMQKKIAIVGGAGEGQRLARLAQSSGITVCSIVDDSEKVQGQTLEGHVVRSIDSLVDLDRSILIVIASHRPLDLVSRIRSKGFDRVVLFSTLQILYPEKFLPHMFYDGWIEQLFNGREQCAKLSADVADDVSRQHLDAIVGFRMTMNLGALVGCIDWDVYYPKNVIELGENEVYADAGAYDGDSVRVFIDRCGGRFDAAFAFEPDPQTAVILANNFVHEPRVTTVPKGLFDRSGTIKFSDDGSRGARIDDAGETEIPVVKLDDYLSGRRATFIKMNIEGAEGPALEGAKETIARWKPRLAISAYHSPSDLWRLPAMMKQLNPSYRLFVRQHDLGVIENCRICSLSTAL